MLAISLSFTSPPHLSTPCCHVQDTPPSPHRYGTCWQPQRRYPRRYLTKVAVDALGSVRPPANRYHTTKTTAHWRSVHTNRLQPAARSQEMTPKPDQKEGGSSTKSQWICMDLPDTHLAQSPVPNMNGRRIILTFHDPPQMETYKSNVCRCDPPVVPPGVKISVRTYVPTRH